MTLGVYENIRVWILKLARSAESIDPAGACAITTPLASITIKLGKSNPIQPVHSGRYNFGHRPLQTASKVSIESLDQGLHTDTSYTGI